MDQTTLVMRSEKILPILTSGNLISKISREKNFHLSPRLVSPKYEVLLECVLLCQLAFQQGTDVCGKNSKKVFNVKKYS